MLKVIMLNHTPNPSFTIANAAKLCYSSATIEELKNSITDEKANSFVNMLSEIGHESPIEHAYFTFGIEGVSRSLLAQITRHRMASFSVQSQRYVKENKFEFIIPPEINDNEEAKKIFLEAMENDIETYEKLTNILKEKHLKTFLEKGQDEKTANRNAEKKAIEDARFVLPNAAETKMVVTMNARSLNNFFHHRCCERAQWEIREVSDQMLKLVREVAPELFKNSGPSCVSKGCPEGKMSCGKIVEIRNKYKKL